jgi:nitronate monooxygenase
MNNILTEKLKIQYPIIQAPMLGVSTPEMAAIVSNLGGLGSLPVGSLSAEVTQQLIRKTKSLTDKPFAVNLFAHNQPAYNEEDLESMKQLLMQLAAERGYELNEADLTNFRFYTYHDQIDILIQENIPIVSFTFGCLDSKNIKLLKDNGCTLIGTATCLDEALILEANNIDIICLQGIEAGGHRGTFIENMPLPKISLSSLLTQVVNKVRVPVIAAGGINNAQTIHAAFNSGAMAVQVGTAFIGTAESAAIPSYKAMVGTATGDNTVLTRAFSGRWARGFRNEMMTRIEDSGIVIPPFPIQVGLTTTFRKLAQQNDDNQYTTLWAGQSAQAINFRQTDEVFAHLIQQLSLTNS